MIKTSEANLDTFEQSSRNVEASSRSSLLFGTQADQKSVNTHVFHGAAGQVDSGAVFTHDGQSSILHGTLSPAEIRSRGRKSARPNERAQERPEKETAGDRLAAWEHELIRRAEALDQAEETLREAETRCAESATEMEQARADLAEALRNASRREEECARREEECARRDRACAEREAAAVRQAAAAPPRISSGTRSFSAEEVQLLVQERGRRAEVEDRAARAEARLARANDRLGSAAPAPPAGPGAAPALRPISTSACAPLLAQKGEQTVEGVEGIRAAPRIRDPARGAAAFRGMSGTPNPSGDAHAGGPARTVAAHARVRPDRRGAGSVSLERCPPGPRAPAPGRLPASTR